MKSELQEFLKSRGKDTKTNVTTEPLRITRKDCCVYRAPSGTCKKKPNLIDPNAKDGPVKIYTREEIEEYQRNLNKN